MVIFTTTTNRLPQEPDISLFFCVCVYVCMRVQIKDSKIYLDY